MFASKIRTGIINNGLNVHTWVVSSFIDLLDCPHHCLHSLEPSVVWALNNLQAVWSSMQRKKANQGHFGALVCSTIIWLLYSVVCMLKMYFYQLYSEDLKQNDLPFSWTVSFSICPWANRKWGNGERENKGKKIGNDMIRRGGHEIYNRPERTN